VRDRSFRGRGQGYERPVDRDARLRENEEVFRRANERLESVLEERLAGAGSVPFLCECADSACMGRVELTLDDYRDVRTNPHRFVMLPGHRLSAGEKVVAERDRYEITEKPD
jgi:hypothetical protein